MLLIVLCSALLTGVLGNALWYTVSYLSNCGTLWCTCMHTYHRNTAAKANMRCASLYFTRPLYKCSLTTCLVQTDHSGFHAAKGGSNVLLSGLPQSAGWLMESILTFLLVFVVFAATDQARAQSTAHLPILAPAGIGFAVFVCHIAAVPIDGTSINREFQYTVTAA